MKTVDVTQCTRCGTNYPAKSDGCPMCSALQSPDQKSAAKMRAEGVAGLSAGGIGLVAFSVGYYWLPGLIVSGVVMIVGAILAKR